MGVRRRQQITRALPLGRVPRLRAVIFDMDGTLAETECHVHRLAFNRSFERLGLPDRWDETLYGKLLWVAGSKERLRFYFDRYRPLPVFKRDRLAAKLHQVKNDEVRRLLGSVAIAPRTGILRLMDGLHAEGLMAAVATSGSQETVGPLLEKLLGPGHVARLASIITGEDVARKKPDPEAYCLTLSRLGVSPQEALAIEDSQNGLGAAAAAGLPCLIAPSFYSQDHNFRRADLVVEELGDAGLPIRVLYNPHQIKVGETVDVETLRRLHHAATAPVGIRLRAAAGRPRSRGERGAVPCQA